MVSDWMYRCQISGHPPRQILSVNMVIVVCVPTADLIYSNVALGLAQRAHNAH
jgi:hypothetical protein